jgi:hypothetical protein
MDVYQIHLSQNECNRAWPFLPPQADRKVLSCFLFIYLFFSFFFFFFFFLLNNSFAFGSKMTPSTASSQIKLVALGGGCPVFSPTTAEPPPPPPEGSPLMLSRCVKKKDCLWKSSMARTIGPSRLLLSVFLEPLLSAMSDSSMVRTMYSLKKKGEGQGGSPCQGRTCLPPHLPCGFFLLVKRPILRKH